MIRSMTGYASVRDTTENALLTLEIKSLNHRGVDIHFYAPRSLAMLEIPLRERFQARIRRGRVEIYIRIQGALSESETIRPNIETARAYLKAASDIAQALELSEQPRLEHILNCNGVIELNDSEGPSEAAIETIFALANRGMDELLRMKESEGERLHAELRSLIGQIEQLNNEIETFRETVMDELREKLLTRIREWKDAPELDPNRLLQEVAFYTDRADIQEETVRLRSHIQQFREMLGENGESGDYKAVGRRLDFLCQELFREANTIGSKSASLEISKRALALKSAIEQLREQAQNVE